MRLPTVILVLTTLLATGNAQICSRCLVIQGVVSRYLESYRNSPVIHPSLDYPKIETHIGEEGGATDLAISFTNFEVIGISGFELASNKFTLIDGGETPGLLNLTIIFPELIITGENYKIFGIIADVLPLHADGPFEIKLTNVNLQAHGLLYTLNLYVENVIADVKAEALTMEMVNILGDLSDAFNEMMSEIGLDILGEFKDGINKLLGNYLEKLLNDLLPGTPPGATVPTTKDFNEDTFGSLLEAFISHRNKN